MFESIGGGILMTKALNGLRVRFKVDGAEGSINGVYREERSGELMVTVETEKDWKRAAFVGQLDLLDPPVMIELAGWSEEKS